MMKNNTVGTSGLIFHEPLIFERSVEGRHAYSLPPCDVPETNPEEVIPQDYLREEVTGFPEVSEIDVVRHFTRLSQWNYSIDSGFFPLGSCTMKYNPKVHENLAALPGFARVHPHTPAELSQGIIRLMVTLERYLSEISGFDRVTLQPAAGAHGELAGMMLIRAYLEAQGNPRKKVIIPDSAHGTNPASCTLCGYTTVGVASGADGCADPQAIADVMDEEVAALMITNPNTLGLFEANIAEISEIVHAKGGLVYGDGANLNALLGRTRPGDMGIDVMHFNLHKTFSTPHGGGGPGSGPVAIKDKLVPFMPIPTPEVKDGTYYLDTNRPQSIGKVRAFYGNFGMMVRAYAYILAMGAAGLKQVADTAVINANYLRAQLQDTYHLAYKKVCKHECVFSDKWQTQYDVTTMDIVKRLMDYGFHPPTVYFPLIVHGALMIEPTETESKETLDEFIAAMKAIAKEAQDDPDLLKSAPHTPKVRRLDETTAARKPRLRY
ncbi:aminotransferase class V-fold PLP-dependent enzyme [candidate division KSB3 bacterium]|uniref:Probable glycine dehydrogenase (decarboxylating) subunit 2 n=1 Tax=candidate division KSB3 bacterium TaxID=2044937 RepID=A0A9D5Q4F7_9BACT|nr:aminotransferase class V-fold PLP-dependent enzyme [candidate division KSB3 bacterium]MBD3323218.1 aminotransferase class V-fold PLP-dependent enzyme [candidate division KSB3 bacterium]